MLAFALEKPECYCNVSYAGEGVVLISTFDKVAQEYDMLPFYFLNKAQAYTYIIKFTNALLTEQSFQIAIEEE